jgi:hypothetical protein
MLIETPEQIMTAWPQVRDWIASAIAVGPGDEDIDDVLIAIAQGRYQLWHEDRLAVVTQVQEYPRQKVLMVLYAGGPEHSGAVARMHALLERERARFKAEGITKLRVQGRRDWSPHLKAQPYYVAQVDI